MNRFPEGCRDQIACAKGGVCVSIYCSRFRQDIRAETQAWLNSPVEEEKPAPAPAPRNTTNRADGGPQWWDEIVPPGWSAVVDTDSGSLNFQRPSDVGTAWVYATVSAELAHAWKKMSEERIRERYALALLTEEMGEVLQLIGKGGRFGMDSTGEGTTPRSLLSAELGDVVAAIDYAHTRGLIDGDTVKWGGAMKLRKLLDSRSLDRRGRRLAP